MMEEQTIRATLDGATLVWQNGTLEGDQALIDTVGGALEGDTSDWLPFGYPASTASPHAVVLALRERVPGIQIEENPALQWEDEVPGDMPPDEITPEELVVDGAALGEPTGA